MLSICTFGPLQRRALIGTPLHHSALAGLLGCSQDVAMALPVSKYRKSAFLAAAPLVAPPEKVPHDGTVAPESEEFYDLTSAALEAAGRLPAIRVDGPYGAPTQDVFKADGPSMLFLGGQLRADNIWEQSPSSSPPALGSHPSHRCSRTFGAPSSCFQPGGSPRPEESRGSLTDMIRSSLSPRRYMQQQNRLGALRRVQLIWTVRDSHSMSWFNSLLRQLEQVRSQPFDESTCRSLTIRACGTGADRPGLSAHQSVLDPAGPFFHARQHRRSFGDGRWDRHAHGAVGEDTLWETGLCGALRETQVGDRKGIVPPGARKFAQDHG